MRVEEYTVVEKPNAGREPSVQASTGNVIGSSKLDCIAARHLKKAIYVLGQGRSRWRSRLRLQPRKMLEDAKLAHNICAYAIGRNKALASAEINGQPRAGIIPFIPSTQGVLNLAIFDLAAKTAYRASRH
jgi:hypothetical protein